MKTKKQIQDKIKSLENTIEGCNSPLLALLSLTCEVKIIILKWVLGEME